jgi:spore coat protein H
MKKGLTLIFISLVFSLFSCDKPIIDPDVNPDIEPVSIETFDRFFQDSSHQHLTVRISEANWDALDRSMLAYRQAYGNLRDDTYVEADLVYEDDDGTLEISSIGFRTRGNTSRTRIQDDDGNLNMSHFKISFDQTFDYFPGTTSHAKLDNRRVFELEEIDLKYNRNMDPTYLNEKFSLDLFNAFGVYAQKTTLVDFSIEIGGEKTHYGLYTAFEPIDEQFIRRRFDADEAGGNLYKCLWQQYGPATLEDDYPDQAIGIKDVDRNYRPAYDLKTNKKTEDHLPLETFIHLLNHLDGESFHTFIAANFNVDQLLRLLAVGVVLGNPDDYRAMANNYYLYQEATSKRWSMIPYDYDHGLGQGWDGAPVFANHTIGEDIHDWGKLPNILQNKAEPDVHPLTDKILSIPTYQIQYENYIEELINRDDLFDSASFHELYETQKELYDEGLDTALLDLRFGLRNIEDYIREKRADLYEQLRFYRENPDQRG